MSDRITETLCNELRIRAELGRVKYGVTAADRIDLTRKQWLQHAKEEALDIAVYLQKLIELEATQ